MIIIYVYRFVSFGFTIFVIIVSNIRFYCYELIS